MSRRGHCKGGHGEGLFRGGRTARRACIETAGSPEPVKLQGGVVADRCARIGRETAVRRLRSGGYGSLSLISPVEPTKSCAFCRSPLAERFWGSWSRRIALKMKVAVKHWSECSGFDGWKLHPLVAFNAVSGCQWQAGCSMREKLPISKGMGLPKCSF